MERTLLLSFNKDTGSNKKHKGVDKELVMILHCKKNSFSFWGMNANLAHFMGCLDEHFFVYYEERKLLEAEISKFLTDLGVKFGI